jgi:hypothetical protein
MDTINFFLTHHSRLYFQPGGIQTRIENLNEMQIRCSPYGMNSIAWLLWHIARCEDVGINRFVVNAPQVIDQNNWYERLNLKRRDIGTGMSYEEVIDLSKSIEVNALKEYLKAVALKTQELVKNINGNELDISDNPEYVREVLNDEQIINDNSKWVEDHYINKTRGWFLGHLGLTHCKGHLGQILILRKLQGLGSGGK